MSPQELTNFYKNNENEEGWTPDPNKPSEAARADAAAGRFAGEAFSCGCGCLIALIALAIAVPAVVWLWKNAFGW